MEVSAIIEQLRELAVLHAENAKWYRSMQVETLFETESKIHKTFLEIMETITDASESQNIADIKKSLDQKRYSLFCDYRGLQSENFIHLAELKMSEYLAYGEAVTLFD